MTPVITGFDLPAIWQAGKSNPYLTAISSRSGEAGGSVEMDISVQQYKYN